MPFCTFIWPPWFAFVSAKEENNAHIDGLQVKPTG